MTARLQWSLASADLDPGRDSEQHGLRPVLVVSNEEFNEVMSNVTVLPLTSTCRELYPSEVLLVAGKAGQKKDSIVMAHQIRTISKRRLGKRIGSLDDPDLRRAIRLAMLEHLDLS